MGEADKGQMPPRTYLLLHGDAALSPAERDLVVGCGRESER